MLKDGKSKSMNSRKALTWEVGGSMGIYILEDQQFQAEVLKKIIGQINTNNHFFSEKIHIFGRGQDILEHIYHVTDGNIYFLDIQIKDDLLRGLEVAKEIRKIDSDGIIVFVTTHSEFAIISYKYMVSAFTFIEKNSKAEEFHQAVEECLIEYNNKKKRIVAGAYFLFKSKSLDIKLPYNDIFYFRTTYDHRIELVAKNQIREFFGELKQLEQSEKRLTRIHQSYLVNLSNVMTLDKRNKELVFANEDRLPISRKYYKSVLSVFTSQNAESL